MEFEGTYSEAGMFNLQVEIKNIYVKDTSIRHSLKKIIPTSLVAMIKPAGLMLFKLGN